MLRFHGRSLRAPAALLAVLLAVAAGCERPARSQRKTVARAAELGVPQASPGGEPYGDALRHRLAQALADKGPDYRPRTRHLAADGSPQFTNRLIEQTSPYLLQHAHNPVNWYPWGEAAFADARRLGRPILLSVGYSTCHWCHVMERESFEDLEIAEFLNAHYIPIKVDREERPDIDAVYMEVVQGMTGSGGWPMTVLLTPDGHPFFAGTYFPARDGDRGAPTGFLTLLKYYAEAYARSPSEVTAHAAEIARRLQEAAPQPSGGTPPGADVIERAVQQFSRGYDTVEGGFGGAPKFPRSAALELLMHYHRRRNDARALAMVTHTLEKMAAGGIHDHIGGGFHRYSTDPGWLVPHFEKMLYDNALLASAYLDAYQLTTRADFADVVREILDYVLRDMTEPSGGFASATDADSPGPDGAEREGLYFTWTPAEVEAAVGKTRAPLVERFFGIRDDGQVDGRSVVHVATDVETVAASFGVPADVVRGEIAQAKRDMARARERRAPPAKDTKVITAWNGLMISALARAARVLDAERYAQAAVRAAEFVLSNSMHGQRLARSWSAGSAHHQGVLDDYAFFAAGLIDLFEATQEPRWLAQAVTLQDQLREHFWDSAGGGFYLTPDDGEPLLTREKPTYDGALPSGNAMAISNLLRLYELTSRDEYRRDAERALSAFAPLLERAPTAAPRMLCALDWFLDRAKQVVIVTGDQEQAAKAFLDVLAQTYLPNAVVVVASHGRDRDAMERLVPLLEEKTAIGGKTTAYVCEREVCKLPTSDPATFRAQIRTVTPLRD